MVTLGTGQWVDGDLGKGEVEVSPCVDWGHGGRWLHPVAYAVGLVGRRLLLEGRHRAAGLQAVLNPKHQLGGVDAAKGRDGIAPRRSALVRLALRLCLRRRFLGRQTRPQRVWQRNERTLQVCTRCDSSGVDVNPRSARLTCHAAMEMETGRDRQVGGGRVA